MIDIINFIQYNVNKDHIIILIKNLKYYNALKLYKLHYNITHWFDFQTTVKDMKKKKIFNG